MKRFLSIVLGSALALTLLGGCGHDWYYDSSPHSGPTITGHSTFGERHATQSGLVRYAENDLYQGTTFESNGGTLTVKFKLPGKPLPNNLQVEYATTSYYDSAKQVVRPLKCAVTGGD